MLCNSTFIQQLLISACVWLPFQSTALEVEPKNTRVDFNMYAAWSLPIFTLCPTHARCNRPNLTPGPSSNAPPTRRLAS